METKIDKNILNKRLREFTLEVIGIIKTLPKTEENRIFGKQIIRSSSSIGANYAEAIIAQTKQDFIHCLKISRKEANETLYWLDLIYASNSLQQTKIEPLINECRQILKILISSIKTLVSK